MIRKINAKDKRAYLKMSDEFYSSNAVLVKTKAYNARKTFELLMEDSSYVEGYLHEVNNIITGYMLLTFRYSNEIGGFYVHIDELYVKPEFQGLGIGSKMIDFVNKEYATDNNNRIMLEVNEENIDAIRLYEKRGFDEAGYRFMIKD